MNIGLIVNHQVIPLLAYNAFLVHPLSVNVVVKIVEVLPNYFVLNPIVVKMEVVGWHGDFPVFMVRIDHCLAHHCLARGRHVTPVFAIDFLVDFLQFHYDSACVFHKLELKLNQTAVQLDLRFLLLKLVVPFMTAPKLIILLNEVSHMVACFPLIELPFHQ